MLRSFAAFSARQQNQTSPPTKLQLLKKNVFGDSLGLSSLHSLLSRASTDLESLSIFLGFE